MLITRSNTLIEGHLCKSAGREQDRSCRTALYPEVRGRKLEPLYRCHNLVNAGALLLAEAHTAH